MPERPAVVPMAPVFSGCGANGLAGACCCGCGWVGMPKEVVAVVVWGANGEGGTVWPKMPVAWGWAAGVPNMPPVGGGWEPKEGGRNMMIIQNGIKKVAGVSILLLTVVATDCQL